MVTTRCRIARHVDAEPRSGAPRGEGRLVFDSFAIARRFGTKRWRRVARRSLSVVAVGVVSTTLLTGCHGKPHAVPVFTGLEFPAAFTLDPNNNTVWYAERLTGEIRRRNISGGADILVWTVPDLLTQGERGLLGLALHPNYPFAPVLYAYATRNVGGIATNQILRIALSGGVGVAQTPIVSDPGAGFAHDGGRIAFGPDGFLYAVVGEHGIPANAQTISGNTNLAGKVLRIGATGQVPADNPFPGSYVWAYGIRNSFGFAFDPAQDNLWLNDNGPACNDEVNLIVKGGNHAWGPEAVCTSPPPAPQNTNQSGPQPRQLPKRFYADSAGITGAVFCDGCQLGLGGRLLVGSVTTGEVRSLTLDASRTSVVADELLYDHPSGVLSMETRPGRPIYFSDVSGIYRLTNLG
jgi:glucose/arabinose dehydrogenase